MNILDTTTELIALGVSRIYPAWSQDARERAFSTNGRDGMEDENTADAAMMRAVVYIRVNEPAVGDAEVVAQRIERQRVRCEMLANEHGLTIVREYIDRTGALPVYQRSELQRLFNELRSVGARFVITGDLERVSRNARELIAIEKHLIQAGAELLVWGEGEVPAHLRRRMAAILMEYEARSKRTMRKEGGV